jgi:hypothetical protein
VGQHAFAARAKDVEQRRGAVGADLLAGRDVLVGELGSEEVGGVDACADSEGSQRRPHPLEGPPQVDRGRTRLCQREDRSLEGRVGGVFSERETQTISARHPDQRRAAHDHRRDGAGHGVGRRQRDDLERVGQARLIDHADGPAVGCYQMVRCGSPPTRTA